ncbi:MAG: SIS domain-containing protein, partial [Anaerorhabdus sp.]
ECGKEKSFTAAKSYIAQLTIIIALALHMSEREDLIDEIKNFVKITQDSLNLESQIRNIIPLFRNVKDILLIGRGLSYAVSQETELKIQEASYTNAKSYAASDYQHGPIATTERFTPILYFANDIKTNQSTVDLMKKLKNDFKTTNIMVTNDEEIAKMADYAILLPKEAEGLRGVYALVIFSQMFACLLSFARGYHPDKPMGLSKTTITF